MKDSLLKIKLYKSHELSATKPEVCNLCQSAFEHEIAVVHTVKGNTALWCYNCFRKWKDN